MSPRWCAVSVDLDEIYNYESIHGLAPGSGRSLVYTHALPRFSDWAAVHGLPLTLFAVGRDLRQSEHALALARAVACGHEASNHSLDHRYDLTRLDPTQMREQVQGGIEAIRSAVGRAPVGFRAPGYTINDALVRVLEESGVLYDSSVFPCPAYWLAKAGVMLGMRLRGRSSRSILDTPRVLSAPTRPYRLGRPYHRPGRGLVEFPIQTTRGLRLPFIGTSLVLVGPRNSRALVSGVIGEPLVSLELHGIDLLDTRDGLEHLAPYQPDLRVPLPRKLATLGSVVEKLRAAGYRFVTLANAADVLSR